MFQRLAPPEGPGETQEGPMDIAERLAKERRMRLAAERLLEQKSRELFAANEKLALHARALSDQIVEQRQVVKSALTEAEMLKGQNTRFLGDLEKAHTAAVMAERRMWDSIDTIPDGFAVFYLYYPTVPGNYYCVITTADGCARTTATLAVSACRGDEVPEISPALFDIYPNPTDGDFTINLEVNTEETQAAVTVMNMVGDVLYSGSANVANGTLNNLISLNDAAAGMYVVRVVVGQQEFTKQIVVQK